MPSRVGPVAMQACADKLAREIEQYGVEYLRETGGVIEAAEVRMPTHGTCRLGVAKVSYWEKHRTK